MTVIDTYKRKLMAGQTIFRKSPDFIQLLDDAGKLEAENKRLRIERDTARAQLDSFREVLLEARKNAYNEKERADRAESVAQMVVDLFGAEDFIFMPSSVFNVRADKLYMAARAALQKAQG